MIGDGASFPNAFVLSPLRQIGMKTGTRGSDGQTSQAILMIILFASSPTNLTFLFCYTTTFHYCLPRYRGRSRWACVAQGRVYGSKVEIMIINMVLQLAHSYVWLPPQATSSAQWQLRKRLKLTFGSFSDVSSLMLSEKNFQLN